MAAIYLFLLLTGFLAFWTAFHNQDEVHNLAAILAGVLSLVWLYCLAPWLCQGTISAIILFRLYQGSREYKSFQKKEHL